MREEDEGAWSERNSQTFIDYGRYMVPEREVQIETICELIAEREGAFHGMELCCGEGLLAEAILERFAGAIVHGYDGSPTMLEAARKRLERYGARFSTREFDLAASDWRKVEWPLGAVVSSLAIHHLDGGEKRELYRDVYGMLGEGGALVIADLVQPAGESGLRVAAKGWDEAVRERSLEIDGDTKVYDFFVEDEWNIFRYPDPTDKPSGLFEQLRWLEEAGFGEVDVYWMKAGHAIYGGRKITK
jgi:tRNA (cmo5U34)-methyltransferase